VAFSSHTDGGKLKYTTPSLVDLHGRPYEDFNALDNIAYDVYLVDYDDMTQEVKTLKCELPSPASYCRINYSRDYTPQLYQVTPRVMYYGSEISFWIDPRSAQNKKSPVFPEFPWIEVKMNEYHVDFEGFLEETTWLNPYSKNNVRGIMGAVTPNVSVDIQFKLRVGYALHVQ
jgi:hypothetical protein